MWADLRGSGLWGGMLSFCYLGKCGSKDAVCMGVGLTFPPTFAQHLLSGVLGGVLGGSRRLQGPLWEALPRAAKP